MSRIGKTPITIPNGVDLKIEGNLLTVKGPKGELSHEIPVELQLVRDNGVLRVERTSSDRFQRSQHGLQRTLIANMVTGVSDGFQKTLEIVGVGYRATQEDKEVVLQIGYSHPVRLKPYEGITLEVAQDTQSKTTVIHVRGIDKQRVGQQAADIRAVRPPDAYKGKGIRYKGEVLKLKPGKRQAGGKK